MRKTFASLVLAEMSANDKIRVVTADLGYGILDNIREEHEDKFFNVGAAEQLMLGVGIGMANEGLIPLCYSMSSFVLYRPFEMLRNYLNHENIPVKLVGSGRDFQYSRDGISHYAHDARDMLTLMPNIQVYYPHDLDELREMFPEFLYNGKPSFLSLSR